MASVLIGMRVVGADEQVQALLARDPATYAHLDDEIGVPLLLGRLRKVGADEQVRALAERAVTYASLDNTSGVDRLLEILQKAGAHEQVAELSARLPAAGLFDQFLEVSSDRQALRFGWEPHERIPAQPWSWHDLD
ncbi:hypothetical protein ACGFIX_33930 [Nocardia salmonicida]|uniref:hypothetical protein n=1 Tax=Nocardia salmonicida TaxID=53431 RepID=UPI0037142CD4